MVEQSGTEGVLKCRERRPLRMVVGCMVSLVSMLMIMGVYWYGSRFSTGFQEMIYTLTSPMKGTGNDGTTLKGILFCGIPTLVMILLYLWAYHWAEGHMLAGRLRRLHAVYCAAFLIAAVAYADAELGISDYIGMRLESTSLYEEAYVPPKNVLHPPQKKKNLVWLYMESMETAYADTEHGGMQAENLIPNLTEIAAQGVSFGKGSGLRGYTSISGTSWTMASILASTSGIPYVLPEGYEDEDGEFLPGVTTLGDILKRDGYAQMFMCGSDAEFGGRARYFRQHGQYEIYDYYTAREKGKIPDDYFVWWGFEDRILYQLAREEICRLAEEGKPFNFTFLTVDTHNTGGYRCAQCPSLHEDSLGNTLLCADAQAAEFVRWLQAQPFWEDTVLVMVGDHPRMDPILVGDAETETRPVYNCILGSDRKLARSMDNRQLTTMDLFPTVMEALGYTIEGRRLGIGTSLYADIPTLLERYGTEELSALVTGSSEYYLNRFVYDLPGGGPLRGQAESGRTAAE